MTTANCPRCKHESFSVQEIIPKKGTSRLRFVFCENCGAVVGVIDQSDLSEVTDALTDLESRIRRTQPQTRS